MTHSYQQKYLYGTLIIIILICISAYVLQKPNGQSAYPTPPVEEIKGAVFTDTQNLFSITVPDDAIVITDKTQMAEVGYLPSCNTETAVACLFFASTTYPNSNFQNASISLNVSPLKTEESCLAQNDTEQKSDELVKVGGVAFESFTASDAAMSHQSAGMDYRTFRNGTCYEITSRVNTTSFEVYEEGSKERFTESQKVEIEQTIEKTIQSFMFLK